MARIRSVDFLPEIFQTETNKQFLAATLDQLVQEPKFKKTQGFIGRTVGPGVNPNDKYVVEPNKVRADYQLEAGVISLIPDTNTVKDAITYPGILDSIEYQGGDSTRPDRLFESQYYTWDPFINWDSFINFSQYFWLPNGPDAVEVRAAGVPAAYNFDVTRTSSYYSFSGVQGNNPTIDLVRGGSYTFQVAQNQKQTINYRVTNNNTAAYIINQAENPTISLVRGNTYTFSLALSGEFPFYIKTLPTTGLTNIYSDGVTNNGAVQGVVTFVVPQNAPDTLYYAAANQSNMQGQFNVIDAASGTGSGFWIQTAPGVSGRIPATPNISSRTVLGVTNNGEDLGTITFNVPTKTAQQFYYDLAWVGGSTTPYNVDLITELKFDQINGKSVADFIATQGGIDGITELNGRTLVFDQPIEDASLGGWNRTTVYDPLQPGAANNGLPGSYDSLLYAEETPVPVAERYSIWQINYVTNNGIQYIQLNSVQAVENLQKFFVRYGNIYASTTWYKNDAGIFRQVPLLSAVQDTLYYQDGTNPEIFGRIRLIDQSQSSTLFIEEILGKKTYTSPNGVTFTNGLKVVFQGTVVPSSYFDVEYYVAGVGTAIELLPVSNFVVPEEYSSGLDYLTIDRASRDLNAWSRSNRWFHIDVINATAEYNNTTSIIDNSFRAKRPIIEFRPDLRLFNMGTEGKQPVDVIDFAESDAFSNVQGATSYEVDGYSFVNGSRVIFAADQDADVRNKIWVVNFVEPDSIDPLIDQPIINLTLASDGIVLVDQSTVCLAGDTIKGVTFWYDGAEWIRAQNKESVQQAPLFNVYDADGVSFSNLAKYPSSTFVGSKLFSYAIGDTNLLDPILQFPLQYLNLNNVGDIVFENNLYKDTFLYVRDNVSTTEPISSGFVREYADRTAFTRLIGWVDAVTDTEIRQQFKFTYDGEPLKLDIKAEAPLSTNLAEIVPAVKVYVGSDFKDPGTYTVTTTNDSTTIVLDDTYAIGDVVEVLALSTQTSQVAFYQVPINLEKNPLNGNSDSFTLGTIRTHYESICENLTNLSGPVNGANNTRDLGDIGPYGLIILQQSAPLTLAGYFNRSREYNIFASLQYNSREYTKFKNLLLQEVTRLEINFQTAGELLTEAIANVTAGRVETNPFYWSDMLPTGSVFIQNIYTVSLISTNVFDTVQVYNFASANYLGLLVYKNDELLTRGFDYTVATDGPRITITTSLAVGDKITIQEFSATYGSFVPNTPTKLGLYPAWKPEIATVTTSSGTAQVIVGHDGSQTPVFGDIRDQVLLEFEKRVYSNLKLDGNPVPLLVTDVLPGQFRETGYSYSEINDILSVDFLSYVGWNKLDYNAQNYNASNEFTWNYSNATNKLNNQNLLGAWRGIYRYFYDTEDPSRTPWEMLGFTVVPDWWTTTYGPAPYTNANLVLWDDLELGLVRDPVTPYVLPQYARPGLSQVIPVDSEGNLLSPFDSVVGNYDDQQWQRSWAAGDGGPVEASWWNSSSYPFAVMRLLALTRPAKFYSLFADRDLYRYNDEFGQYLYDNRYRLDANGIQVYGDGVSKASFINWIVDYNQQKGLNSTASLQADLANLDVRLCYRMASFSDKQYIKLYTEKSSPNSLNSTLLIPDESYDLLLYKNQPFDRLIYSSVVVQQVEDGYAVYGYSTTQPYFDILVSQGIGRLQTITVGDVSVKVPTQYTDIVAQVPYGYVFTNPTSVCDFLLSYGKLLDRQGLTFEDRFNGFILDWSQMAQEFLYWSQQGWEVNSLINLNPLATKLNITKPGAVADSIVTQTSENVLLNQNKRELDTRNLNIVRLDNTLTLQPLTAESLSFADIRFTNYEHMIVLNNKSVFGDLIYEPITGARQSRLNLVAVNSTEWNGTVDAQGFILNQNNVEEWTGLKKYTKGQIVKYKDQFWSAQTIVDPKPNFDFNDWVKSDYEQIEKGLLPNIANKSNQLQQTYSVNSANLEADQDLFSYGLIGFRPRQYMAALNLDDVSQVNIYQQFLKTKGTILAAELLSRANLGKEAADYNIYENWAVQRAVYGANANRSFVELRLNRALLSSNPSLVQVVIPQQQSQADQQILLSDVWRQSYKLTSPDFLPTTEVTVTDTALPSAGYVNLNDIDITTFTLADGASINADLADVKVGASIWVAKVNNYDWNVYRCVQIPGYIDHVCDNLNGTSIARFTKPHGLSAGNQIIIRYLDPTLDGVYDVLAVPDINSVIIAYTFTGNRTVIDGTGIGFTLQSQRVAQPSDIINLPYANEIITGNKVWIDNNGNNRWTVVEKQNPFSEVSELAPRILEVDEEFGTSVAQAKNRLAALVGSPNYLNGQGGVYVYVKNYQENYEPVSPAGNEDAILTLEVEGAQGYGNAVDFGGQTWAVAGASRSLGAADEPNVGYACVIYRDPVAGQAGDNPYAQWQLIVPEDQDTDGEFGYSVTMSQDERWMYIGAPGANKVYAYGRVDWEDQVVKTIADGSTQTYFIGDKIQVSNQYQLRVTLDGALQSLTTDYTVDGGFNNVTFVTEPAAGAEVEISRYNAVQVPYTASSYDVDDDTDASGNRVGIFGVDSIYSISVTVNGILQRPSIDYTIAGTTVTLTPPSPFVSTDVIVVSSQGYFEYVDTLTASGLAADARFGHSVSTSTDGRQILVGTPNRTVNGEVEAGSVYVFDRNVQKFIYNSDSSSAAITVAGTVAAPVSVIVNNQFLVNEVNDIAGANGTFSVSGNTVTIEDPLQTGDIVEIETNQFSLMQVINQNTVAEFTNFGQALDLCSYNCSLYVGAPQDSTATWKAGAVQRSVNQSRIYGTTTATVANPTLTVGNTLRINNIDVAIPAGPLTNFATAINAEVPNVTASVSNGFLTIAVKNAGAAAPTDKLQVAPGSVGNAFASFGFNTYVYTQTLYSPYPTEFAKFGYSVSIDETAVNLVVGSPNGTLWLLTIWDDGTVDWDGNSTTFFSTIEQSGSVYTYDYLPAANESPLNPGKFVFGLQISDSNLATRNLFGTSVSYVDGVLMLGAPGHDADSSILDTNYGRVFVLQNPNRIPAWTVIREQKPVVDVALLNGVFTYDRITSARTEQFDFIDPLQGKILGAARQNIDYIGAVDPAQYNTGPANNNGTTWSGEHVGEMWWDISSVRFIDPNQDDIVYASRRWSQLFPGSTVDVYQWIESTVPPATYTGPGTPLNVFSYTVNARLGVDGTFNTYYYFWVRGITTVATQLGKTLSANTVARYIENPKASGIPYIAAINSSTIALYNANNIIEAEDTVINIEYDRVYTSNNVHVEYELIAQDKADGFLSDGLYRKLQDSFCGVDTAGNLVPDPNLNAAERYGVQFRPRQSMFVDRFEALKNYLQRANNVLSLYPISESRSFTLLNSSDPEPESTTPGQADPNWNMRVANLEILSFQNIYAVPIGYKYLVASDSDNNGLWTIYQVQYVQNGLFDTRELVLIKVQNYDTKRYWSYINWYLPGYNTSTKVIAEVPNYSALATLTVPVGSSVRVVANAQGKWEIYLRTITGWDRVGLEDGTIAFSAELWDYALGRFGFDVEVFDAQYFDQEPVIETRKIIQAINEELFVDNLLIERNRALTLMFNYVLSEFAAPEWLVKTSLVDVDHRIRNLEPFQNYRQDNQEFVLDYIQEVKPYHVQIREFNLLYNGQDQYLGDVADFDVPAYYNTSLPVPQYTSPILNVSDPEDPMYQKPYLHSTAEPDNILSDADPGAAIWQVWPYTQWYNNYLMTLESIRVTHGGSGYTDVPSVTVAGDAVVPATAVAVLTSFGSVGSVRITNPGSGYSSTPTIVFSGGNGSGAAAYPVLDNSLVRSFKTIIKYDRCSYQTQIVDWAPNTTFQQGTLVRYDDRVWEADSTVSTATFDLADWTLVPASDLGGVDRTAGYYVPGVNEPGLDIPLLIDGIAYPGVQVYGRDFASPETLDAIYSSSFADLYLGTRFTDINVDGGEFIGLAEGHAPEELVNGSEFDTVDIRVYTRPGSDWSLYDGVPGENGHGFQIASRRFTVTNTVSETFDWSGLEEHPVYLDVSNVTTGVDLSLDQNYTIDWVNSTLTVTGGVAINDVISVTAYELGGGSQLFRGNFIGDNQDFLIIPVAADEINEIAMFVNGTLTEVVGWDAYYPADEWNQLTAYSRLTVVYTSGPAYYRAVQNVPAGIAITNTDYWQEFVPGQLSKVVLPDTYTSADYITLVALGITSPIQYSWSTPQTEYFVVDATINSSRTVELSNYVGGTNPANMIVEINGQRLRPYEGIEYNGNGTTLSFGLPQRGGYNQDIIDAPTDITVYVNDVLQTQDIGAGGDYSVTNWDGSNVPGRQVVFVTPPAVGDRVLIAVSTAAEYLVVDNQLQLVNAPTVGAILAVTTFNDTSQQNILTLVFQGPVNEGVTVTEPYDTTAFDAGSVTGDPGSYDYSEGAIRPNNDIDLERAGVSGARLWVTLNGYRLFDGVDYTIQGQQLILASGPMSGADILVVTEFTESVVPEAMAFRIFQDMRGVQATYRITPATTTALAADLAADADVAYLVDASALTEPDLPNGVFGVCTINAERIMYRSRNTALNTISGLMRGTAGTAATSHSADSEVYDMGRGNLMYEEYQDRVIKDSTLADGSTVVFSALDIDIAPEYPGDSSTEVIDRSVEVYVGGTRQYPITEVDTPSEYRYTVLTTSPVSIEFTTAPADGAEVTIAQRQGKSWYNTGAVTPVTDIVVGNSYFIYSLGDTNWTAIGAEEERVGVLFVATAAGTGTGKVNTASDGIALQETNTQAARFFRGF